MKVNRAVSGGGPVVDATLATRRVAWPARGASAAAYSTPAVPAPRTRVYRAAGYQIRRRLECKLEQSRDTPPILSPCI